MMVAMQQISGRMSTSSIFLAIPAIQVCGGGVAVDAGLPAAVRLVRVGAVARCGAGGPQHAGSAPCRHPLAVADCCCWAASGCTLKADRLQETAACAPQALENLDYASNATVWFQVRSAKAAAAALALLVMPRVSCRSVPSS